MQITGFYLMLVSASLTCGSQLVSFQMFNICIGMLPGLV